jgi:hypothetical protein
MKRILQNNVVIIITTMILTILGFWITLPKFNIGKDKINEGTKKEIILEFLESRKIELRPHDYMKNFYSSEGFYGFFYVFKNSDDIYEITPPVGYLDKKSYAYSLKEASEKVDRMYFEMLLDILNIKEWNIQ